MSKWKNMRTKLLVFVVFVIAASCSKPGTGVAKQALDDLYPHSDYLKTVYTESMIRSAANMAGLDSSFAISSHTDYIYQFEVDLDYRLYRFETDSIFRHAVQHSQLEKIFELTQPAEHMSVYVQEENGFIKDAVFYQRDSVKIKVIEFVGNMPMDVLFKEGLKSYAEFGNILNLGLFEDERNDTTNL